VAMNETYYQPSEQFDALSAMLAALPDSPGVLRLGCEIPNYPSFFPGGRGYKGRSFPQAPIMLIGHNFDTEAGFRRSVARGSEDHLKMKTWVNMKESFLPTARLSEDECFFTNFYLGAIVHPAPKPGERQKTKNTGTFKCTRHIAPPASKLFAFRFRSCGRKLSRYSAETYRVHLRKHSRRTPLIVALTWRIHR
jgi:hypothetical protein